MLKARKVRGYGETIAQKELSNQKRIDLAMTWGFTIGLFFLILSLII